MHLRVWYKDMGGLFGTVEKGSYNGIVVGNGDMRDSINLIVRKDDGTFEEIHVMDIFKSEWVEKP